MNKKQTKQIYKKIKIKAKQKEVNKTKITKEINKSEK